jgi:CRP/FNR family transcriptional regulator, cyclic AMP receptor protein
VLQLVSRTVTRGSNIGQNKSKSNGVLKKKRTFPAQAFLDSARVSGQVRQFKRAEVIFSQGAPAESVMYIQKGRAKITALSAAGKEAIIAIFGPGDFFGEACLAGQPVRMGNATSLTPSTVLVIDKSEMLRVLHERHDLSNLFIDFVLKRNIRIEEDLVGQLFNSTEKRLARTLLLLAGYGKQEQPERVLPKVSQQTLAETIGATPTQVKLFMNKFKKLGFIKYDDGIHIKNSLLSVVLHD